MSKPKLEVVKVARSALSTLEVIAQSSKKKSIKITTPTVALYTLHMGKVIVHIDPYAPDVSADVSMRAKGEYVLAFPKEIEFFSRSHSSIVRSYVDSITGNSRAARDAFGFELPIFNKRPYLEYQDGSVNRDIAEAMMGCRDQYLDDHYAIAEKFQYALSFLSQLKKVSVAFEFQEQLYVKEVLQKENSQTGIIVPIGLHISGKFPPVFKAHSESLKYGPMMLK
jgi:hypothetical protein